MPDTRPETTAGATTASAAEAGPASDADGSAGAARGTRTWWFVAPAFVLGLFAGAVLLALLREDPPSVPATATEAPAGSDAGSSDGTSTTPGASAEITVNEACLRVVNGTQDLIEVVGDLGDAAAGLDISGLDQAVRRLQPLESRLREDLDGCETDTTLPGDLSPLPTATDDAPDSPTAPSTTSSRD